MQLMFHVTPTLVKFAVKKHTGDFWSNLIYMSDAISFIQQPLQKH